MGTARNNVTEISRFAKERQARGKVRAPLDDCREMSVLGLKKAFGESLDRVKEQLLPMAEKVMGQESYNLYMEALELVRDYREPMENVFQRDFLQRFNRECRRDPSGATKGKEVAELSLMGMDDLEDRLASDNLANAIHNTCAEELFGLDQRIGLLINDPHLSQGDNPLGPEVISAAVMEALDIQDVELKPRLLAMTQLSKCLPESVKTVYQDINRRLVERNVMPTIRVGMRQAAMAPPPPPMQAGSEPATEIGNDVFTMLQRLMGVGGNVPELPVAGAAAGSVPNQADSFMHALSQMQRGYLGGAERSGEGMTALGGADLVNGTVNVLRDLRKGEAAENMTALDGVTVDIVAMVFDYVFEDKRIPDAIKALIGRLQIPVLKVAMLDKTFFSQRGHPTRRLLDAMADAAIGWDAGEGHEGGLYLEIERLVVDILENFEAQVDIFSEALDRLNNFLAGERRKEAEALVPSVLAIQHRELVELGNRRAHEEVESTLIGQPVPPAIVNFLTAHWQPLLAELFVESGEDSEAWQDALTTMADLVWSVLPKSGSDERKQLVAMLSGLLKGLDNGIDRLGLDQNTRDAFFAELVQYHAKAVKSASPDETEQATFQAVEGVEEMGIPRMDSADFELVEPLAEPVEPAMVQKLAEEVETSSGEEDEVTDLNWLKEDADLPPGMTELDRLKRGSWIEYRQEDETAVRAKLSWISPLKGMYLFTNRHGQRAISINAEALLDKLQNGEVRILNDARLMDRAVGNLMEQLQQNAA